MDLARFKKKESSVGIIVPAVTKVNEDGSFETRSLSGGRDQFGRDLTAEYFHRIVDPNRSKLDLIKPKTDYEMFVLTDNEMEADLLAIDYYMGTDFKNIKKPLGGKKFIVKEKLQVKTRISTSSVEDYKKNGDQFEDFHDNNILKYRGIAHQEKQIDDVKYEGDCNTEIQLHDDCKFKMYKFIGIRNIS